MKWRRRVRVDYIVNRQQHIHNFIYGKYISS
jgi:hypothetical protein